MTPAFEKAWEASGPKEGLGKWSNRDDDRGGETYTGMARKKRPDWDGWILIDQLGLEAGGKWMPDDHEEITLRFREILDKNEEQLLGLVKADYFESYWARLGLDKMPEKLALELFDTGLNQGTGAAAIHLQRILNALNRQGKLYPDLKVDGDLGPTTTAALNSLLKARGPGAVDVVYKYLNCLQGNRYIDLAERDPSQEQNTYGWAARLMES